jgi:sec-independent protein translocase protein TatA
MFDGLLIPSHLLILGLIAVLLFGAKRLPEMGRQLGSGLRGFREPVSGHGLDEFKELKDSLGGELREAVGALPAAEDRATPKSPPPD